MIARKLLLVGLLLYFTQCGYQEFEVPEGYLKPEEIKPILVDLHIIEGAKAGITVVGDTIPVAYYYDALYQKYNISAAQLDSNISFYASHQKILEEIYENVINDLITLEAELEKAYSKLRNSEAELPPDSIIQNTIDSLKIALPGKSRL